MAQSYKSPGVTVQETQLPQPLQITGPNKVVAVVGNASTTYVMANVEVTRGAGVDTIPDVESGDVVSVIGIGSLPALYDYAVTTDYSISGNQITWGGASEPALGVVYYVTFNKLKGASFYEPTLFEKKDDVRAVYGNELNGGVLSEISLAAALAFDGGASQVMCVQPLSASTANQKAAIDKLELEEVYLICAPGFTTTDLQAYLLQHVTKMSSPTMKKERGFITSAINLTDSVATITSLADGFNSINATVIAPPAAGFILTDGISNIDQTVVVSGAYMGASIAGTICGAADEAEPITEKQVVGVSTLNGTKYSETEMNTMAGAGTTIVYNDNGIFKVRHALTTDNSSVNNSELEIWNIRTTVKKEIRTSLRKYIGTKYVPIETHARMTADIVSYCEQKLAKQVFAPADDGSDKGYRNISVTQDANDPRKCNVHFEFRPVYTLTYCDVSFSLYL